MNFATAAIGNVGNAWNQTCLSVRCPLCWFLCQRHRCQRKGSGVALWNYVHSWCWELDPPLAVWSSAGEDLSTWHLVCTGGPAFCGPGQFFAVQRRWVVSSKLHVMVSLSVLDLKWRLHKCCTVARAEYFLPTCILFFLPLPVTSSSQAELL